MPYARSFGHESITLIHGTTLTKAVLSAATSKMSARLSPACPTAEKK